MSGPKCSKVEIVSAEELARRAQIAERDRFDRARERFEVDLARYRALCAAQGSVALDVEVPVPQNSIESLEASLTLLEAEQAALSAEIEQAVRQGVAERASKALVHFNAPALTIEAARSDSSATSLQSARERAANILARLSADVDPAELDRIESFVGSLDNARSDSQLDAALIQLRSLVGEAERSARGRHQRRETIETLERPLDGLGGSAVIAMRGFLRGIDLNTRLDLDLRARVAEIRATAEHERDRTFALKVLAESMEAVGLKVGDDFVTSVGAESATVRLPGHGSHGVRVREHEGRILTNIVRFDQDWKRSPMTDKAAEETWCDSYHRTAAEMKRRGVAISLERADAPGQTPVQVEQNAPWVEEWVDYDDGATLGEREIR